MSNMKSICVFCGSSFGNDPSFASAARKMGIEIAQRGLRLVYGGGDIGTMGILAAAALDAGGRVLGIIPEKLHDLVGQPKGAEIRVVAGMHERKALMSAEADAFAALPGGIGTYEEFFEAWVWRQLGYHDKPVGLLNVSGFYTLLIRFLREAANAGFMNQLYIEDLVVEDEPGCLIESLARRGGIGIEKLPPRSARLEGG